MIFDPIFSMVALAAVIWVAVTVFKGHDEKLKEVIDSEDEGKIRDFALKCCSAHRWQLISMAIGMTVMVFFSMPLGLIIAAVGALVIDRFGQMWFFSWITNKLRSWLPNIKLPW